MLLIAYGVIAILIMGILAYAWEDDADDELYMSIICIGSFWGVLLSVGIVALIIIGGMQGIKYTLKGSTWCIKQVVATFKERA